MSTTIRSYCPLFLLTNSVGALKSVPPIRVRWGAMRWPRRQVVRLFSSTEVSKCTMSKSTRFASDASSPNRSSRASLPTEPDWSIATRTRAIRLRLTPGCMNRYFRLRRLREVVRSELCAIPTVCRRIAFQSTSLLTIWRSCSRQSEGTEPQPFLESASFTASRRISRILPLTSSFSASLMSPQPSWSSKPYSDASPSPFSISCIFCWTSSSSISRLMYQSELWPRGKLAIAFQIGSS